MFLRIVFKKQKNSDGALLQFVLYENANEGGSFAEFPMNIDKF